MQNSNLEEFISKSRDLAYLASATSSIKPIIVASFSKQHNAWRYRRSGRRCRSCETPVVIYTRGAHVCSTEPLAPGSEGFPSHSPLESSHSLLMDQQTVRAKFGQATKFSA
ncbi:hypothetical protein RRG08_047760 [Elysia crispata]|uniref:Uncharacterized protein n=1 Tax=Elysia crispata TaxID=231223 RepID=A0AAE1A4Q7_9GAST|nr:hypothetical protein RRG08_047760 [Elysia crispata]